MPPAYSAETTDEQLLRDATRPERGGPPPDRRAMELLARRHEPALLGLARGILSNRDDLAADAVQETWLRVLRFGSGFKGSSPVKTWLYRIAINQCRTILAAQRPESHTDAAATDDAEPSTTSRAHDNGHTSAPRAAEHAAQHNEALLRLRTAVDRLADAKRELLLLCYHAGLTHDEAAAVLEIPLGTLKSRLHSALEDLRASLAANEVPSPRMHHP